jgi:hypothetical protein
LRRYQVHDLKTDESNALHYCQWPVSGFRESIILDSIYEGFEENPIQELVINTTREKMSLSNYTGCFFLKRTRLGYPEPLKETIKFLYLDLPFPTWGFILNGPNTLLADYSYLPEDYNKMTPQYGEITSNDY